MNEQNFDNSTFQINDALTVAENNSSALKTAATNNKKMILSSKLENFKIEIGPKVIESCSILRNVLSFTSDNEPIEVEMSKKQLKKFVKLHEHFEEDDPWDKEDPNWTNNFFLKMSENEFKQFCWSADFLDSKRFLHSAAIYILSKIRDVEVEDIQNYLNIVSDFSDDEKYAIENDPLKYFGSIAIGNRAVRSLYDIHYLLTMDDLWKDRRPPTPLAWEGNSAAGTSTITNKIWPVQTWEGIFTEAVVKLGKSFKEAESKGNVLVWDKDDDIAMNFVSAANIRAQIFHIPIY